jgi:glycosyltransferase involved in cell wall biosynthesis
VEIMNKVRVVHILPMLSPGGAERVAVHIVRGLNRQRFEPSVISFTGRLGCELDHLLEEAGIEVRYLGKRPGFDYRMFQRLGPALADCRPEIVHTHLHVLRYALPFVLLRKRASVLHTVHNLAEREIESGMRWLQGYALKHRVVPVAVAEEAAHSVKQMYGIPRCRVIPNGIPTRGYAYPQTPREEWRAREGFSERDVLFVCVARFAPQKNHALLLNAFALGPASNANARLVLVGDGVLREQLEQQARSLGVAGQVHFLGLRSDIPDVLGAMDAFVMSSDFEGHPLSVIEAMASGLPIVGTAVGGMPGLVENGKQGLLVAPGDARDLCEAMTFLLQDRETRRRLGMAGARRARNKFDVSAMVRAYEDVYEELVEYAHHQRAERRVPGCSVPAEGVTESRNP